jgi:hypothetical protein
VSNEAGSPETPQPRGPDLETWLTERDVFSWFRRLAGLGTANSAALLTFSALLLYAAGLFRTIAQLHAENVQSLRGLPLAPLQTYFVEGLAMAFDLNGLFVVVLLFVLGATPLVVWRYRHQIADWLSPPDRADDRAGPQTDAQEASASLSPVRRTAKAVSNAAFNVIGLLGLLVFVGAVVFGFLFMPAVLWAPYLVVGLPFVPLAGFLAFHMIPQDWRRWTPFHSRLAAGALAFSGILFVIVPGYFNPPPLDQVAIRTVSGRLLHGKLITQSNGLTYLVGTRGRQPGEASIVVIPGSRIARMEITKGRDRYFRSLAEVAGLRLWRLELDDEGQPHVRNIMR